MKLRESFSGFLLLLVAAVIGLALLWLPSWVISNYQIAASWGFFWGAAYLAVIGTGGLLFFGSAFWIVWKLWGRSVAKRIRRERRNWNPSQMSREQMSREVDENLSTVDRLKSKTGPVAAQAELDPLIRQMVDKRRQQTLEIVAFGTISGGKSSVLNLLAGRDVFATQVKGGTTITRSEIPWPGMDRVVLVDTPGLGEVDGAQHVNISTEAAKDADLVLLIIDGPLRRSEFELLEKLSAMEKRILICLNKSDWFTDEDRQKLIGQISRQAACAVEAKDVLAVQAEKGQRTRRRVMADGSMVDERVEIEPNIAPLATRMLSVLRRDGKDLLAANLLLQSRGLVERAKDNARQALDRQAWKIVDRYMWGAGGLAAVSPWPVIDLATGCAVSTKMILDLAEVYQQKVDLETAAKWLGEMGKNLIGVVGAQGATVAVSAVVASLIKSVPVAGTIAGGVLQGAAQALITKWIGAVFVEYFRNEMRQPEGGLAGLARRQWENVTRIDELRKLVAAAREKLSSSRVS